MRRKIRIYVARGLEASTSQSGQNGVPALVRCSLAPALFLTHSIPAISAMTSLKYVFASGQY